MATTPAHDAAHNSIIRAVADLPQNFPQLQCTFRELLLGAGEIIPIGSTRWGIQGECPLNSPTYADIGQRLGNLVAASAIQNNWQGDVVYQVISEVDRSVPESPQSSFNIMAYIPPAPPRR